MSAVLGNNIKNVAKTMSEYDENKPSSNKKRKRKLKNGYSLTSSTKKAKKKQPDEDGVSIKYNVAVYQNCQFVGFIKSVHKDKSFSITRNSSYAKIYDTFEDCQKYIKLYMDFEITQVNYYSFCVLQIIK